MSIRPIACLLATAALGLAAVLGHVFLFEVVPDKQPRIQERALRQEVERAFGILDDRLQALDLLVEKWTIPHPPPPVAATAEDAVAWLAPSESVFRSLDLGFFLILDGSSHILFAREHDAEARKLFPPSTELVKSLREQIPVLFPTDDTPKAGFFLLGNRPAMAVSHSLSRGISSPSFPARLIAGRFLDEPYTSRISRTFRAPMEILPLSTPPLPPNIVTGLLFGEKGRIQVERGDSHRIAIYALLNEISGRMTLALKLDRPAHSFGQDGIAQNQWLWTVLLLCLAMTGLLSRLLGRPSPRTDPSAGEEPSGQRATQLDESDPREHEHFPLAAAAEQCPDVFFVTDEWGRIEYANRSFERMSGYGREEVLGRRFDFAYRDAGHRFHENLRASLERHSSWKGRIIQEKKSGALCELETTASLIQGESGETVGYVFQQREVTLENRVEKAMQRAQKMEALGTFAGGIAHDFNNVLAAIMAYADMALEDMDPDHPAVRDLTQIMKASCRARDLVNQILTFARHKEEDLRPLKVMPIVKEAVKFLEASVPKNVEVQRNLSASSDTVQGSPTQIHQLIMNLCANAVQAIGDKPGTLEISLNDAQLNGRSTNGFRKLEEGAYLELLVKDTGCGMDEALMERIFEPYFTMRHSDDGTGLGLAMVHGIVRRLKGGIQVESAPGRGSEFRVLLPCLQVEPPSSEEADRPPLRRGRESILLVDDDRAILGIFKRMLRSLGYRVTAVASPAKALAVFRKAPHRFDVAVLDYMMPVMNGLDLAREIRHDMPEIPVVLCLAIDKMDIHAEAARLNINQIAAKPLTLHDLSRAVENVLEPENTGKDFNGPDSHH